MCGRSWDRFHDVPILPSSNEDSDTCEEEASSEDYI